MTPGVSSAERTYTMLGSLRRTHRDFADVVELIAVHSLSREFARHLHKSVRKVYRELVLRARGESK